MVISLTSSQVTAEQATEVESFLAGFLPRMRKQPGVEAIYHFHDPEQGESTTIVIWRDDEARAAYRDSDLIKEPMAFEQQHGMSSRRTAFPLTFAS